MIHIHSSWSIYTVHDPYTQFLIHIYKYDPYTKFINHIHSSWSIYTVHDPYLQIWSICTVHDPYTQFMIHIHSSWSIYTVHDPRTQFMILIDSAYFFLMQPAKYIRKGPKVVPEMWHIFEVLYIAVTVNSIDISLIKSAFSWCCPMGHPK